MNLVIEDSVPLPAAAPGQKDKSGIVTALRQMKVGQSILVPGVKQRQIGNRAAWVAKRTGKKFTTRAVEGGTRIWCIEDSATGSAA